MVCVPNLTKTFLQKNSTCNNEALQNALKKKRKKRKKRKEESPVWREKIEVRSRKVELWKLGKNKIIHPSLVHCLLGHHGD